MQLARTEQTAKTAVIRSYFPRPSAVPLPALSLSLMSAPRRALKRAIKVEVKEEIKEEVR